MVIGKILLTKNLADACAKYAGACGKKSILFTKPVKNVNISELGVYLSDDALHFLNGKIRYKSPAQAADAAKRIVMKQFNLGYPQECNVLVEGTDILGVYKYKGEATSAPLPFQASAKPWKGERTIDVYHNHPVAVPLSDGDIFDLLHTKIKSITAFNKNGEYSCAEIIDIDKAYEGINSRIDGVFANNKLITNLADALQRRFLNPKEYRIFKIFDGDFGNIRYNQCVENYNTIKDNLFNTSPDKYGQIFNEALSEILPAHGVKYSCNMSL